MVAGKMYQISVANTQLCRRQRSGKTVAAGFGGPVPNNSNNNCLWLRGGEEANVLPIVNQA